MSPSPFHGIFSFGNETQTGTLTLEPEQQAPAAAQEQVPAPAMQKPMGQIAVDIYEHDDYYIIRAPIAGVRLSDLDIEVDGKVVTISGTRRQLDTPDASQYYLEECFWGDFSRSITLPCAVDAKKVKATFSKDCILKILIPREEEKIKIVRVNEGA